MKQISRYLLTLVALFAMTAGAWAADESETITTATNNQLTFTGEHFTIEGVSITTDGFFINGGTNKTVTISAKNGENITKTEAVIGYLRSWGTNTLVSTSGTASGTYATGQTITISNINATTVTLSSSSSENKLLQVNNWTIYYTVSAPGEMTLNADATEATMEMPGNDVTVDYELARDMAVEMSVTVQDEQGNSRIRLKKAQQGGYEPAEMTIQQMMAMIHVHDGIENQDLVFYGDGKVCDISIFAVDDQDQPTGQAIAFTALTPGRYVAIATAADGTIYDGTTAPSNIFQLYQGYEVEVAANSFITYYKDEALYVDESTATGELYTIDSVTADAAVLSSKLETAPANVPLLVYNNSDEAKTILLIPTTDAPLSLTWYGGFVGTLAASTIPASDASTDRYAFNGRQFVWVKNALAVGANKAWLEIPAASNARVINIEFGEATGIANTNVTNLTNGDWYDLNGRKLNAVPTKKGVYILNGRKVVVK